MDRSFLSRPDVVAASRAFVCVRLATYEDRDEGAFLTGFRVTRSGELENTVFTILAPDGKRRLVRASREAGSTFDDAGHMSKTMKRIVADYPAPKADSPPPALPAVANLRLAINVAACDNQPLVLVFAPDARARKELETRLAALAWSDRFIGRFIYASASAPRDLADIAGAKAEPGVLVIQSDRFGQKGKLLIQGRAADRDDLVRCLTEGARLHQREEKTFSGHVREGHRLGVFWDTAIPVTDPMEKRARERGRNAQPRPE